VLGAARAGTTSLHQWLAAHPDACMSIPKETQFFSVHWRQGPDFYRSVFSHHQGEAVLGESTPIYLTMPYVAPRIAELLPSVQLVAVLREPVRQMVSAWWKLRSVGAERRPLDEAIRTELESPPLDEEELETLWHQIVAATQGGRPTKRVPYLLTGLYLDSLRRYHALFPKEQVTTFLHEDLVTSPADTAAAIASAVGLDPSRAAEPTPPRVNETQGPKRTWLLLHTRWIPSTRVRGGLAKSVGWLDKRAGGFQLDAGLERESRAYFRDRNHGLSELIGRDVAKWFEDDRG
jgi:hypothetical protein